MIPANQFAPERTFSQISQDLREPQIKQWFPIYLFLMKMILELQLQDTGGRLTSAVLYAAF